MQTAKRYPPGLSVELHSSWLFRGLVLLLCGFLIATYLIAVPARSTVVFNGLEGENWPKIQFFDLYGLFFVLSLLAGLIAVRQAWRTPTGRLIFSQGSWQYSHTKSSLGGDVNIEGTLDVHFDLQLYLLARFTPSSALHSLTADQAIQSSAFWVHLESRQYPRPQWLALRRAVYSLAAPDPLNSGVTA